MDQMSSKEEHYSVRWTSHSNNLIQMFTEHRLQERLADVTLICEGQCIKAHKIILSSCSTYFNDLFKMLNGGSGMTDSILHPLFVLVGEKFSYLNQVIQFIYQGEIKVPESDLEGVLALGEKFQIKGLCSVRVKHKVPDSKPVYPLTPSKLHLLSSPIDITKSESNAIPESSVAQSQSPKIRNIQLATSTTTQDMPYTHKLPIIPVSSKPVTVLNRSNNFGGNVSASLSTSTKTPNVSPRAFGTIAQQGNAMEEDVSSVIEQSHSKKLRTEHAAAMPRQGVTPTKSDVSNGQQLVKVLSVNKKSNADSNDKLKDISTSGSGNSNILSSASEVEDNKKKHVKSLSPFMIFASEWRKKLAVEHPGESNKEISVRLGNLWKNLSSETKQTYYSAAMKEQWKQDVTDISPASDATSNTVKKRRMTADASLNWRTSSDEDTNMHIINLDSDSSSAQQKSSQDV